MGRLQSGLAGSSGSRSNTSRTAPPRAAAFKSGDQRRLVDDPSAGDVDNDRPGIEKRDLLSSNQPVGSRYKGRGDDQNVGAAQGVMQAVGTNDVLDKCGKRLVQTTPDADDAHTENICASRDFLADCSQPHHRHLAAAQTPRPRGLRQFILNPSAFALGVQHQIETPGKQQQASHDMLGDRNGLNPPRIRYENSTACKFT